jgi:hypothetical protein
VEGSQSRYLISWLDLLDKTAVSGSEFKVYGDQKNDRQEARTFLTKSSNHADNLLPQIIGFRCQHRRWPENGQFN